MERMRRILDASLLWRGLMAVCLWFGGQWRNSNVVQWFLHPGERGRAAARNSLFFRLWQGCRGALCWIYEKLRLDRLFAGSIFLRCGLWCALTAAVYLTAMGPHGLRQAATLSMSKAHYLAGELEKLGMKRLHAGEFFHEFVTTCPDTDKVLKALDANGILGGLPVEGGILWCATEVVSREELDRAVSIIKGVL